MTMTTGQEQSIVGITTFASRMTTWTRRITTKLMQVFAVYTVLLYIWRFASKPTNALSIGETETRNGSPNRGAVDQFSDSMFKGNTPTLMATPDSVSTSPKETQNSSLAIYLFTFQKDAGRLLPLWLWYHSSLVGTSNIHVIDHMSKEQSVKDTLAQYQRRGLILTKFKGLFKDKGTILSEAMQTRAASTRSFSILVPLDVDEFIVKMDFQSPEQFTMEKASILRAFARLPLDGYKYTFHNIDALLCQRANNKMQQLIRNLSFQHDFGRLAKGCKSKVFYPSQGFVSTDQGNHLVTGFKSANGGVSHFRGSSTVEADSRCSRKDDAYSESCGLCFHRSQLGLVHLGSSILPYDLYEAKMIRAAQAYDYPSYLSQNMSCEFIRKRSLTTGGIQYCHFLVQLKAGKRDWLKRNYKKRMASRCSSKKLFQNTEWDTMFAAMPNTTA